MLPTHDVHCPRCEQFLYSALSLEDVVDSDAPSAPRVEHDERGSFLRCPHCRTRIAMKPVLTARRRAFRPAS